MMFTKGIDEMSLTHVPPRAPLRQPPMDGKAELPLLRTGVPGLDDVLGGGLPALSFNLIVGQSGSGKTTMAMQMLFANATLDAPGLFITLLGEPPLKLLRYQQRFAFFDVAAMGKTVQFLDLSEDVQSGDLEKVQQRIAQEVERVRPGLVVIDSFRGLVRSIAARDTDIAFEEFVQRLALHMTAWEVTSVLVGEHADSALRNNPVFTVADGIFSLLQDVDRNSMVRKLQVIKMRGMSAMPGLHTMRISETGVQVYPRMPSNAADVHVWSNARASTGMQALDEMMAGGIPRGDAVIIAGPAGTGKTTFVTQFVADGLRHDESCVILIFEERPETYLARARTRDVDFGAAIDAGKLRLIYVRPLDLSVDETFDEVSKAVQEIQASRVVIDSISGFELALAPTFRQDFRESLYRLVNGITGLGVTIVMTVEVIGGEIGLQFTNYGVSFLTDDIIVQRYVEIEGQLRKVLMIVKMRGSWHSRDFRIYDITADGVAIGARLREYNDIISGVPRLQSRIRLPVYAGLTDREVLVLEAIIRAPGVDAPRLATMMQLPGDALAAALERLTELGWVLMTQGEGGAQYHGLARELDA